MRGVRGARVHVRELGGPRPGGQGADRGIIRGSRPGAARPLGRRRGDHAAGRGAVPPVRQPAGDRAVLRGALADPAASRAGQVRARARAAAGWLRRRLRLPQRGHEQRRGRHRDRAAAAGNAGLPRRVEFRRPGRSRPRRPARAAPVSTAAASAGRAGRAAGQRASRAGAADPLRRPARRRVRRGCVRYRLGRPRVRAQPYVRARSGVAPDAADRAHRGAVRPDRVVRRVRRGCDRRLGSAAPAAGPRRGRGRGRRGLRGLRPGRGERAAVRDGTARAARPHQGADPGRSDRLRGHAPGQPRS